MRPTISSTACLQGYRYPYRFHSGRRSDYAPVLLIGGAFQSMDALQRFAGWFQERADVILVDPPGTGRADPLPSRYGADFLADSIKQVLDELGIESVNAIGVSFGTAIAYRLAQRRPERVENLVLLGTMSHVDTHIERALETCVEALDRSDLEAFSECVVRTLLSPAETQVINRRKVERILRFTATHMTDTAVEHFRTNARRLLIHRSLGTDRPPSVRTLVFTGEHDSITTPECCRRVAAAIEDACFALIESGDHLVALERPNVCTGLADAFLRGLTVKSAPTCRTIEHTPIRALA